VEQKLLNKIDGSDVSKNEMTEAVHDRMAVNTVLVRSAVYEAAGNLLLWR